MSLILLPLCPGERVSNHLDEKSASFRCGFALAYLRLVGSPTSGNDFKRHAGLKAPPLHIPLTRLHRTHTHSTDALLENASRIGPGCPGNALVFTDFQ